MKWRKSKWYGDINHL